jgi:hypothetical protein
MRRSLTLAGAIAAGGALAAVATVSGYVPPRPPPAEVTIRGLTARAATGSYCIPDSGGGNGQAAGDMTCVDSGYPLHPRGRLPAPPHSRVRFNVKTRARGVTGRLVRRDGQEFDFVGPQLHAQPLNDRRRVWRLRLPQDLRGAQILDVSVEYPKGDADFWAGIRPVTHWP